MTTTRFGEAQAGSQPGAAPAPAEALRLYESMVLIRRVEERLRDDSAADKLPGAVHLYIGEEAVAAGVCAHLSARDYATSTHRGHGHFLAKGGDVRAMMAEIWADAKGLVKTAIRSKNPCFVLEPNGRGGEFGEVPDGEHLVPFGKAAVRREGDAVTVVAIGRMLKPALAAAAALEAEGVRAEVLDPRTLVPFDYGAVLASVGKTGHLVIVDEARECCSAASQVAAVVAEQGFSLLKGPIRRVTTPNVAIPYAPNAEAHVIPGEARITAAVRAALGQARQVPA